MHDPPAVVSDWYALVQGDALEQGDILERCPIFEIPKDFPWPLIADDVGTLDIDVSERDLVVLSQSCDLAAGQKSDMWQVLLCPVCSISDVAKVSRFLGSPYGQEHCRRGHLPAYHMIDGCKDERWSREVSVVSFRDVWGLPLAFVRKVAAACGPRARMQSPYKEHLAQAFARYFMRVGLPADVAPFRSPDAERKIMQRLHALDDETRTRVLDAFR